MTEVYGPVLPGESGEKEEVTPAKRTPRRVLRYAPGHTDLFRSGAADDPMSQSFTPLEQRSEIERARLFARPKRIAPKVVEFD